MRHYKSPEAVPDVVDHSPYVVRIFLGGSIEMGVADAWQEKLVQALRIEGYGDTVWFINPRRNDWDASWIQTKENQQFREQVEWELDNLEKADVRVFYFDPGTVSLVTMLELGRFIDNPCTDTGKTLVCCPPGYVRKGNVDIFCNRYGVNVLESFEELVEALKQILG